MTLLMSSELSIWGNTTLNFNFIEEYNNEVNHLLNEFSNQLKNLKINDKSNNNIFLINKILLAIKENSSKTESFLYDYLYNEDDLTIKNIARIKKLAYYTELFIFRLVEGESITHKDFNILFQVETDLKYLFINLQINKLGLVQLPSYYLIMNRS
jgi:hypothetical protein